VLRCSRCHAPSRDQRHRSWTLEQKREIVAGRLGPELASSEVARKFARTDTGSDEADEAAGRLRAASPNGARADREPLGQVPVSRIRCMPEVIYRAINLKKVAKVGAKIALFEWQRKSAKRRRTRTKSPLVKSAQAQTDWARSLVS
jgi:transposase-like protein